MDDDIQYTFVVPRGEIYRDPDEADDAEEHSVEADDDFLEAAGGEIPEPVMVEPEPAKTIIADRSRFTDTVNEALAEAAEADAAAFDEGNFFDSGDDFFDAYMAADPKGRTAYVEPPVYEATGLSDSDADDIVYTFVVPKGEVYQEPDPEEEAREREAERLRRAVLAEETKVVERAPGEESGGEAAPGASGKTTRYGLPVDHPGMGELAQKQEARRRYKQQKKNRFRTRFYVFLTVLMFGIFWLGLSNSPIFTIDSIVVQGNSHFTAEEIINMGHATPGRNIIYKANIKETKEYLENNPYIKTAEIKRRLPSTLVIKVTERQERMAFKYDDDYLVMDEDGILLRKTRNVPMTTIIQGVVVSKIKLGEQIGTENGKLLDRTIGLIKKMISSDLYFVRVDMSKEKTVSAYIYDTLVVKADYDTLMTNMENGRLHLVVEKLFEDNIERGTITFEEDGSASFMPIF